MILLAGWRPVTISGTWPCYRRDILLDGVRGSHIRVPYRSVSRRWTTWITVTLPGWLFWYDATDDAVTAGYDPSTAVFRGARVCARLPLYALAALAITHLLNLDAFCFRHFLTHCVYCDRAPTLYLLAFFYSSTPSGYSLLRQTFDIAAR